MNGRALYLKFKTRKTGIIAFFSLLFLYALAVFAPLVAMNRPYIAEYKGSFHFPLFAGLLDQNIFGSFVDLFFNIQVFLLPLYLVYLFFKREDMIHHGILNFKRSIFVFFGAVILLSLCFYFCPFRSPYVDWKAHCNHVDGYYLWPPVQSFGRESDPSGFHPMAPGGEHILGTDKEGRDVFARMLYGTRVSLTIGFVSVGIMLFVGVFLGAFAGFFGGWTDVLISRFIELMLCFPTFFLVLTLSSMLEQRSIFHVMLLIGFTGWPGVARLVRAEFLKQSRLDYVLAARALGFSKLRIMFGHVFPNTLGPVIVAAVFGVASAILVESSLSFLGLGDMTVPSWGEILSQGRREFKLWLIMVPGFSIFYVVLMFNLLGESVQDVLDPKHK
jgi:peptide/nickel transport system permease protein